MLHKRPCPEQRHPVPQGHQFSIPSQDRRRRRPLHRARRNVAPNSSPAAGGASTAERSRPISPLGPTPRLVWQPCPPTRPGKHGSFAHARATCALRRVTFPGRHRRAFLRRDGEAVQNQPTDASPARLYRGAAHAGCISCICQAGEYGATGLGAQRAGPARLPAKPSSITGCPIRAVGMPRPS
jgi:hypothetical protein